MTSSKQTDTKLLPDFLIIGAGKSGTTSVNNYLKQHPSIYITKRKEPNFFGYELNSEDDFANSPQLKHYRNSVTDIDSYSNLFKDALEGQKKGETSNTYLYHEHTPERIKHYVPDVKLIAIFRQPSERLYSRYLHLARDNRVPTNDFKDCLKTGSVWWTRNDLINEGFYYKHLSRFYETFSKEQIRVYLFDDLKGNPHRVLKDIFNFIGVDDTFELDMSVEYNKSGFIKNKFYDRLIGQNSIIKKGIQSVIPDRSFDKLKDKQWMRKYFNKIKDNNLHRPKLDRELKQQVTNKIYRDDILKLSSLIERDLGPWLK